MAVKNMREIINIVRYCIDSYANRALTESTYASGFADCDRFGESFLEFRP